MTLANYLKDKILILLLNVLGVFFLLLYLLVIGNSVATVSLIILVWIAVCFLVLFVDYRKKKKYFGEIDQLMDSLDQPYLIQEFMENSWRLVDQLYCEILYKSNRAVIEQIDQLREEQKEYREFLEGWIHEAKLPITGMRLACHNGTTVDTQRIELYVTEMDHLVEKALFFAKSEQVYKDFQVRETDLKKLIYQMISKNKYLLIQNQMSVQVLFDNCSVYSDKKWLEFIFTQIIINAVKYKKVGNGELTFHAEETSEHTKLRIKDNGIGIKEEELGRVFEKGFTGSNGREREKSTGIGLYLCKKLCRKLEIEIGIASKAGEYTEVYFVFPKNSYISKL